MSPIGGSKRSRNRFGWEDGWYVAGGRVGTFALQSFGRQIFMDEVIPMLRILAAEVGRSKGRAP